MKEHTNKTRATERKVLRRALVLLAAIFTAITVAVACVLCLDVSKPVDVNDVGSGEVSTSVNKSLTSAGTYDYTSAGAINNSDTISMAYCNGYYTVKLPQGTYKLEVWGGQGGGKSTTVYGGYGGYTYGQIEFSTTTTVYVYPGGAGGYGSTARTSAFNGGGAVTAGHPGGGGGGASHIATASGKLSALGSGNNNILLVAGGGGGVGCNCASTTSKPGKGGGGHAAGTDALTSHHYTNRGGGYGGSTGGGGRGGAGNGAGSGSFGLGGNQTTSNSTTGGGAGGGGYFGGGAGGADYPSYRDNDDGSGGGGSGFVNKNRIKSGTYGGTTGAWGAASATAYAGKAVITAINVNQPPKTKNATIALFARGTGAKAINASDIATDPEGTSLYFTNGTASNLDAFTTTANTGLYYNSACTSLATKYFDWSWASTSQLKITNVKLYPRSGIDGSTANGSIKLYARVRDSYGSNTQHGWSVISFTVTVPVNSVAPRATTNPITVSAGGDYSYILGNSNTATAPEVNATPQTLYNPLGTGRYTAILSNSLRLGTSFTVKASELIGSKYASDKAIIALNSTTAITGSSRKFRIKEYDGNTNRVTAYNTSKVLISNTFDQITIECLTPDPGYKVFSVTLYIVEPTTAYGASYPNVVAGCSTINIDIVFKMDNTRPVLKDTSSVAPSVTLDCMQSTTVNLNTFFKDADTPNGMTATTHQIKSVVVASREYIQLDKYGNVVSTVNSSGNNAKKSYFNIVPGSSALSKDMTSDSLTTGMLKGSEFSTGFESWYISNGASNTAFVQYGINNNNLTLNLTGLRATHSMYSQTRTASATRIATGGSTSAGISVGANGAQGGLNAGHFYILINILDKNDSADTGIWLPLGITVNNGAPTDMSKERNGAGASVMPTASGIAGKSFYFTPMGITVDRVTYPVGLRMADGELTSADLQPLAADPDNFLTANMLNGSSIGSGGDNGILNELITLTSSVTEVQGSVNGNSGGEYFTVSEEPIYIPLAYFGGRVQSSVGTVTTVDSTQYVQIRGLKITLNGWTHNRYLYATVGAKDSANVSVTANIAINVSNSAPTSIADTNKVAKINYSENGMTVGSSYTPSSGNSVATVTYNIPMHSSVVVTPYDLLTDVDMRATYPASGFTLNGLSGLFDNSTRTLNVDATRTENDGRKVVKGLGNSYNTQNGGIDYSSEAYVGTLKQTLAGLQTTRTFDKLSTGNMFNSAQEQKKSTYVDGLFFERTSDGSTLDGYTFDPYGGSNINSFATPSIVGDAFVSHTFGSSLKFTDNSKYYLDYIIITANSRTQVGAPAEILLNVRDRMGAGASGVSSGVTTIKIVINVINSSPRVQHPDKIYTLTTDPTDGSSWNVEDASAAITVKPSTFVINAYSFTQEEELNKNFLIDNEGDTVMFFTGEPVAVMDEQGNSGDGNGNYLGRYLSVGLTSSQLTITALNSTQSIPKLYVYFSVTDGRYNGNKLETYRCKIQVEVLNALLSANHDEDGFVDTTFGDGGSAMNLWTVESLDQTDISKTRYFASSDAAVNALKGGSINASSDQIKKLVDDTDALQGVILSPVRSFGTNIDAQRGYYNVDINAETIDYKSMVPTISTLQSEGNPVAVVIDLLQSAGGTSPLNKYFDNIDDAIDIIYFVDGVAYSAKQLRSPGDTTVQTDHAKFFDAQGRWIVKDWAVSVKPNNATSANEYIQLNIMMRDETKFGGGTAGIKTGYVANESVAVDGFKYLSYQLAINSLGIVPYTYYDQFDGYYTVRDGADSSVNYVSTYDGEVNSTYKGDQNIQSLYLSSDNKISTAGAQSEILKTRTTSGTDNTAAGVHSGFVYGSASEYVYDVSANGQTVVGGEKAFKYSDTIVVESSGSTYIPMSYFALRRSLVTMNDDGSIVYPDNRYVSYNVDGLYERSHIEKVATAIWISDGVNTWTGSDSTDPYNINNNPYVKLSVYDAFVGNGLQQTDEYVGSLLGNYFNKSLAVTTVDKDNNALGYLTGASKAVNATHLVGNGHLMYLADQQTKLQENMFGIGLSKKSTRASAASLTITIAVADCEYQNGTKVIDPDNANAAAKLTYKLEIGNSPVELVNDPQTGNVNYDKDKGYYTNVELDTASATWDIELLRSGVDSKTSAKKLIRYTDNDVVKNSDNKIDESKSDKAYFFADSLNKLGSWVGGNGAKYYNRAKSYDDGLAELTFDNTATAEYAQKSMRNYFGSRNTDNFNFNLASKETIGNVGADFQPNGGIYGSNINGGDNANEGFSRYFNVTVSGDGSTLSITPLSKTTINAGMHSATASERNKYYNERGLEYDANRGKGYYPLKILIYDSHGDGFMYGSYVALEVRVYIDGAAPTLSPNLADDDSGNAKKGDKKIDVALPVGQSYQYSVADVIRSGSLLTASNGNIYWKGDYDALKNSANKTLEDMFKLDMGTYLQSPFGDKNYGWRTTTNAELRAGAAKLSDGNVATSAQPDVIMFMEYSNGAGGKPVLGASSNPVGNTVNITVNRRTTYDRQQYKKFTFKILFTDSDGNSTATLSVNVEVTNQAPTLRTQAVENAQNIKMRVGDSFTVVTTPYDKFVGTADGNSNIVSAQASTSYKRITSEQSKISQRNLLKISGDSNYRTSVKYSELTAENVDRSEKYKLHSYDPTNVAAQHLGYLAIADDDTPWALRIQDIRYYDSSCFRVATKYDMIPLEGKESGDLYALDTVIVANRVCTNMPVTITVVDEENSVVSLTIYVTVESSRPSPIQDGDSVHKRHEGLLTTYDEQNNENLGVYETYMTAMTDATASLRNVTVADQNVSGGLRVVKNVYGELELKINQLAYDPDENDNDKIALYCENDDYDIFMFNDMPMERAEKDKLTYFNDMFRITVASDYRSFKITCLTYNPYRDWDELKFYVRDVGNNIFDNAAAVTIRISTLNSAVTNEHQSAVGKVTNGIINANTVDTVYVKPYDDYVGVSADVAAMPDEQKDEVIGVSGTYQFLNYKDAPQSIDQPSTAGWGINDNDVVNNVYNRNYDVRVYALMNVNEENNRQYDPLTLNQASALFDLAPAQLQSHYWSLKQGVDVSQYFVGGIRAGGGMISGVNSALNMFLQQYFVFEIGADGVSLAFRPVTSNIDLNILFYVEVHKDVSSRSITRSGAATDAGTIFYVKVKDSAPIANDDNDILQFTGKVGESRVFTIYDESNPYESLFIDSDLSDMVSINAFVSPSTAENDYNTALAEADCDWKARQGVKRAIDIEVNNADEAVNGIPAHSLKVTVSRRIDVVDENGKYATEVTLPVILTGVDKSGRSVATRIYVTVKNSDVTFNENKLEQSPSKFDAIGVGYSFSKDEKNNMYVFDAYVAPDSDSLTMNLVLDEWLVDPDFTSMSADVDSYRLVKPADGENSHKYLYNADLDICPENSDNAIASISPIFGNNGAHEDPNHFAGFTIRATSYERGVTGIAYMRIIDRSANELESEGVTIMVKVTVLNAAPNVKLGMDKRSYLIVGSDSKESTPITIDISEFVEDRNNDRVRIFSMAPIAASDVHCSVDEENGGDVLRVDPIDGTDEKFTVVARKGFYGKQAVLVTVADGDFAVDLSARTTTFTIEFTVIYDFNQVSELNVVSAVRSLPFKVTPQALFKDIIDTFDESYDGAKNSSNNRNISTSADGDKTFNPGGDYVITDLVANTSGVTVNRDEDGDWQFVSTREIDGITFDVSFVRKVDADKADAQVFKKQFTANVGKNHSPVLIEQIRRNNEFTFHTREGEYGLDANGNVTLTTDMLFGDVDLALGDKLTFDASVTEVVSPTMCTVRVSDDGLMLYITFHMRGETDITVGVKDRTGETVKATFKIKNIDRPSPSFMDTVKISYESHPYIWLGVAAGVLALILFIILLIILLKRRKRKQEELEAILVSEMELEEQMMRLSGGIGSAPYQSFGYLPPTMPVQNDPGLMIGAGDNTPKTDVIGLNAGQGQNDNTDGGLNM